MPLVQEAQSTPSPPAHQPTPPATKRERPLKRVRLDLTSAHKSAKAAALTHVLSPRSTKPLSPYKRKKSGGKPSTDQRRQRSTKPLSVSLWPTLVANTPSPSCWSYTGSPFHEQLRDEYLRYWLPSRICSSSSSCPTTPTKYSLFLSERARAADWVEQMFEAWFLAGYGYQRAVYDYPGMESD